MADGFNKYASDDGLSLSDFLMISEVDLSSVRKTLGPLRHRLKEHSGVPEDAQMRIDKTLMDLSEGASVCRTYLYTQDNVWSIKQALEIAQYCHESRQYFTELKDMCESKSPDLVPEQAVRRYNQEEENIISAAYNNLNKIEKGIFLQEMKHHVGKESSLIFLLKKVTEADRSSHSSQLVF